MTTTSPGNVKLEPLQDEMPKLPENDPDKGNSEEKDNKEDNIGRWTKAEHKRFLEALELYGKDWKKVQKYVGTRSTTQARSHAQKYFAKLGKGEEDLDVVKNGNNKITLLNVIPLKEENLEEKQLTAPSYSPAKLVQNPVAEKNENLPRKRIEGPIKPGRRKILCDAGKTVQRKKSKIEETKTPYLPEIKDEYMRPENYCTGVTTFHFPIINEVPIPESEIYIMPSLPEVKQPEIDFIDELNLEPREPLRIPENENELKNDWESEWNPESDPKLSLGNEIRGFFDNNENN